MMKDLDREEFYEWISDVLKPRALEVQIRAHDFMRAMSTVEFLPAVIERQANQKEFMLPIWEYLEIAASEERVRNGRQMLRRYRDLLNRIEQTFGVEPEVVTAIWGLETGYGVVRGDIPTLSALTTLAYRGRRARYFEGELMAALRIVQTRGCNPEWMIGSWAGAMGHGQFMPSAIIDFAVDFDRDGRTDLCGEDPSDALASIANYLRKHGWKTGQPWGFEVRLPPGFDHALTGAEVVRPTSDWLATGVTAIDGTPLPDYGPASILLPAGAAGVAFMVFRNYHVITRYNRSEAYAIGIGHLADRILGGKPLCGNWPVDDAPLSHGDVGEVQFLLTKAGFDTKGVDGLRGPNTNAAVRAWQKARGMTPDGYMNGALLERLRAEESG